MMLPLPLAISPYLGQLYLQAFGTQWFFIVSAVPALIGVALLLFLDQSAIPATSKATPPRLAEIASNRRFLACCAAIFAAGLAFGYVTNYAALVIDQRHGQIVAFFFMFPFSLVIFRFFLLQTVDRWPKYLVGMAGLSCIAISQVLCFASVNVVVLGVAGALYGAGHSMIFPALNAIVATEYAQPQRALPVSLINAVFNTGIFGTPVMVFALGPWLSKVEVLLVLSILCVVGTLTLRLPFGRRVVQVSS